MKRKTFLLATGFLALGAAISVGLFFGIKSCKELSKRKLDPNLDLIAKRIKADYENKEKIEVTNVENSKIKFSDWDEKLHEIIIKKVSVSESNGTTLNIVFYLVDKVANTFSNDIVIEIGGFKDKDSSPSQADLNKIMSRIVSAKFEGDKSKIEAKDVTEKMISFEGLDEGYYADIKRLWVEENLKTLLKVTFTIKHKNSVNESLSKVVQISGFASTVPPKTKERLDSIINSLSKVTYSGDKSKIPFSKADIKNITVENVPTDIEIIAVSFKPDTKNTSGIFTFKIKEKNGKIESNEKSIKIDGFRKPFLTKSELDKIISLVIDVSYDNDNPESKKNTKVIDIDRSLLTLVGLASSEKLKVNIVSVTVSELNDTAAVVNFTIQEEDGEIVSSEVSKTITGFKSASAAANPTDVNKEIEKVKATVEGNLGTMVLEDSLKTIVPKFSNFDENNYEIVELVLNEKTEDSTILQINFKLKDKKTNVVSKVRTIEIPGFKLPPVKPEILNAEVNKVQVDVDNKPTTVISESITAMTLKPKFSGFDDKKFEVSDLNLSQKADAETVLVVKFKLKDKNSDAKSTERTVEISGFKIRVRTTLEVEDAFKKIKNVTYSGNKAETEIKKIDNKLLTLEPQLDPLYEVSELIVYPVPLGSTTAQVVVKIKQKGEKEIVGYRFFKVSGFKISDAKTTELNEIAKKVTATYKDQDKLKVTNLNDLKVENIVFAGHDESKYEVEFLPMGKYLYASKDTPETLVYRFLVKVVEKANKENSSDIFTLEIKGFKPA